MSKGVCFGLLAVCVALLALTTACGTTDNGGSCGCSDGCGSGESDADHAKTLMRQYSNWTKTNAKRFRSKPHKAMITNWVNGIGAKTFRSGKGNYPVGSMIAKEGWKKGKRSIVFFMEKRAGYDSSNGDWWYATVTASGVVKNSGLVKGCAGCHSGADNDFVFGNP